MCFRFLNSLEIIYFGGFEPILHVVRSPMFRLYLLNCGNLLFFQLSIENFSEGGDMAQPDKEVKCAILTKKNEVKNLKVYIIYKNFKMHYFPVRF